MLLSCVSRGEQGNVPAWNERQSRSPARAGTRSRSSRRSRPGPGLLPPVTGPLWAGPAGDTGLGEAGDRAAPSPDFSEPQLCVASAEPKVQQG